MGNVPVAAGDESPLSPIGAFHVAALPVPAPSAFCLKKNNAIIKLANWL